MMGFDKFTGPVNLGNPEEFTIRALAEKILHLTSSSSRIVHKSMPEDDPPRRCPDISSAKDTLGWEPKVGLEEGLVKTIAYFKEKLDL
jgi:UDP-glucuronate decarboxylase